MSRRHAAVKRVIKPDTKYKSVLLSKFINNVMKSGKKSKAEKITEDPHQDNLGTYPHDNSLATVYTKIANSNNWPDTPGGRKPQKY